MRHRIKARSYNPMISKQGPPGEGRAAEHFDNKLN